MGKLRLVAVLGVLLGAVSSAQADMLAPGTPLTEDFVLGPTSPGKWGPPVMGTGATVTWSIMGAGIATDGGLTVDLNTVLPAGFATVLQSAFDAWSAVANITFTLVPDSGLPWNDPGATAGDIRVGAHAFDGPGGVLAHGYYPPANGSTAAGDIHFDSSELWVNGFAGPGFDVFQVFAHEIGHAIGLDHTLVPGSLMNAFYSEAFSGPQADDIAGAQFIYGPAPQNPEVPEPATIVMFVLGAAALPFARRRKVDPTTVA